MEARERAFASIFCSDLKSMRCLKLLAARRLVGRPPSYRPPSRNSPHPICTWRVICPLLSQ